MRLSAKQARLIRHGLFIANGIVRLAEVFGWEVEKDTEMVGRFQHELTVRAYDRRMDQLIAAKNSTA